MQRGKPLGGFRGKAPHICLNAEKSVIWSAPPEGKIAKCYKTFKKIKWKVQQNEAADCLHTLVLNFCASVHADAISSTVNFKVPNAS